MICPRCGSPTKVLRTTSSADEIERERRCTKCGEKFHTTERPIMAQIALEVRANKAFAQARAMIDALGGEDSR